MNLYVCPDCLTRDDVVSVQAVGEPCHRCGVVPTELLTRKEIRACMKARRAKRATP